MARSPWVVGLILVAAAVPVTLSPPVGAALAQPTWTVGDYWDYMATVAGNPQPGSLGLTVTGLENATVGGVAYPSYRVNIQANFVQPPPSTGWKSQSGTAWYRTSDLALVMEYVNETDFVPPNYIWSRTTITYDPPEDLQWPLTPGATWTASGWMNETVIVPGAPTTFRKTFVNLPFTVEAERAVAVPAGTFAATPVNASAGGFSNVTYWSPAVGNGVLVQDFIPVDTQRLETLRLELVDYRYQAGAPVTSLIVGAPHVTAGATYVTSATPLSFSVLDRSGTGIRDTTYRIDDGGWLSYPATGPFTLAGEGPHLVSWSSVDNLGNLEAVANATLLVDNTPPTTTPSVGNPKYVAADSYVTSATRLTLSAADGGMTPVGVAFMELRIDGGTWSTYASPFTLPGEGRHTVGYRAVDRLGTVEVERTAALVVDDTPPVTTPSRGDGTYMPGTTFAFPATDAGSGVARTEVRVDGGPWKTYASPLALAEGVHTIAFYSADHLNNTETERTLSVTLGETPPPTLAVNLKPLVAAVFAAILVFVGAWSSRRAPWPGGSRRRLRAFLLAALPFVAAEGATGVVSLLTGLLSIPPLLGLGTAVDVAVLAVGLVVAIRRAGGGGRRSDPRSSEG